MTKKIDNAPRGQVGDEGLDKRLSSLEAELAAKNEEIGELKEALTSKENERKEYLETLQRVQADTENFRKRMLKEQTQVIEFASQKLVCELLPLVDDLERAIASAKDSRDALKLAEGVGLIHERLKSVLAESGLEAIEPSGEPFDPQMHEAVLQVESDEHEENTVIEVMQKGYCLKGRVIRPAMVKVTRKS